MLERVTDCREPWSLRQALSTDGDLRIAVSQMHGRALSRAMLVSCITAILSLAVMLPNHAQAQNAPAAPNVKPETRAKVERIRLKYPEFKLPRDEQECLDGKLIDPDCDPVINDQVDLFVRKRELDERGRAVDERGRAVDERGRAVDERERELANVKLAGEHIDVVWGLVQLSLFAFDDRVPPKNADFMNIVMKSQTTSTDVRSLFNDFLGRKNRGEKFTSKADSERLIGLADKHLESANALKAQITKDETFKKQVAALYLQAASSLEMAKQILAQKARL